MPTATRNTVATGVTSNPFVELGQHSRSNLAPTVFNRTGKLIPAGPKKKRPQRKGRFGYCNLCRWPLSNVQRRARCTVLLMHGYLAGMRKILAS
jgi:hypothetical protein